MVELSMVDCQTRGWITVFSHWWFGFILVCFLFFSAFRTVVVVVVACDVVVVIVPAALANVCVSVLQSLVSVALHNISFSPPAFSSRVLFSLRKLFKRNIFGKEPEKKKKRERKLEEEIRKNETCVTRLKFGFLKQKRNKKEKKKMFKV